MPPEVWKTRQFDDILLRHCNAVYNQNTIDRWTKGLAKNYGGITLISIAAKIYYAQLGNRREPKIEKILRKNQSGFRRILDGVRAKNLEATILFVDFSKALDSIHRGKIEQILLAYSLPKETVAAIMMLYKNTK